MTRGADAARVPASSVARTLRILGDAWTLRILRDAFRGTRRFGDWQRALGIPRAVLAARLERLVVAGVLDRAGAVPARPEYRLSAAGLDLWSLMLAIWAWETKWIPNPYEQRMRLVHLGCGHSVRPVSSCAGCGRELSPFATRAAPGPGAHAREPPPPPRYQRRSAIAGRRGPGVSVNTQMAEILGDRWTAAIVGSGFRGVHRFGEFESALGISPHLLSVRLQRMVEFGVFERRAPRAASGHEGYFFTAKGIELYPMILELLRWGDRWLVDAAGVPAYVLHTPCGANVGPQLRCSHCGDVLERRALRLEDPPQREPRR